MKKLVKYGILPLSVLALSVAVPQTTSVVHADGEDAVVATDEVNSFITVGVLNEWESLYDGWGRIDDSSYDEIVVPPNSNFVYKVEEKRPGYTFDGVSHIGGLSDDRNPDPKIIEYTYEDLKEAQKDSYNGKPRLAVHYLYTGSSDTEPKAPSEDPASGGNAQNGGGTNEDGGTGSSATENPNPTNSNNNSNASNTAGGSQGDNVDTNNTPTNSTTEVPDGEPLHIEVDYFDLGRPINTTGYFSVTVNDEGFNYKSSLKPGESLTVNPKEIEGWKFEYAKFIGKVNRKGEVVKLPFTVSYSDLYAEGGGKYNFLFLYYSKIEKPSEEPKKPDVNPDLNGNNNTSNNSSNSSSGGQTQTPPTNTGGSNNSNNTNSSNTGSNISLNTGQKPPKAIIPGKKVLDASKNNDSKIISASNNQKPVSALDNADAKDQIQNQGSELSQADAKNQAQASAKVTPKVEAAAETKTLPNTGESMPFLSVFVGIFSIFCLAWAELKHKQ